MRSRTARKRTPSFGPFWPSAEVSGISVLAEGVETERQLTLLRNEGCNEAQGFLLGSRPRGL